MISKFLGICLLCIATVACNIEPSIQEISVDQQAIEAQPEAPFCQSTTEYTFIEKTDCVQIGLVEETCTCHYAATGTCRELRFYPYDRSNEGSGWVCYEELHDFPDVTLPCLIIEGQAPLPPIESGPPPYC